MSSFLLRQERSSRSKYWQHVAGIYNLDVTRRFDLSHLPPIYVHIIYERQLLQGLTLAIVNYTPANRCVYIFRIMWYICVGCASPYKNMLFLMYFNAFSRRYHGWGMREFPKRSMSADTPCNLCKQHLQCPPLVHWCESNYLVFPVSFYLLIIQLIPP